MDLVSLDSPARPIKQPEETTVNIFSENQCNRGSNGDTTVEGEASIRRIIFFFFLGKSWNQFHLDRGRDFSGRH